MIIRDSEEKSIEKIPSYLPIYDRLYSDIIGGKYKNSDMLPSENVLSDQYEVSRNTIRQALTILKEDGLIKKQQGKGSIVTYREREKEAVDSIENLILSSCKEDIEEIDNRYNFGPPTEIASKKLRLDPNDMLLASNNIYYQDKKRIGHSFSQIPIKYIDRLDVDLNNRESIGDLINRDIFKLGRSGRISIRLIKAEDNVRAFLDVEEDQALIYIEQILRDESDNGIARYKYYFIPEYFNISLNI